MIIVTGASGFIGSAIVGELNRRGITDILCVDYLQKDEKWKNLVNLKFTDYEEKDAFIKRVLFDDSILKNSVEGIIHMGACSATTERDASFLIENNYQYTQLLANWCVKNSRKFVYASSAATYGDGSNGFDDDVKSLEKLKPLNMYGYSKHLFDLWASRKGLLEKIAGMKFTNVFGPNEYHKDDMRSVVHKAYGQIKETGKLKLFKSYRDGYEDGEQKRDFIFVGDIVAINLHFAAAGPVKAILNAGTGRARSFNDIAKTLITHLGQGRIEYIPFPEALVGKYQSFTQADVRSLRTAGFTAPFTELEAGIAATLAEK